MTISKRYTAPTLPLPPQDYAQTYGNELIKILRLYFDNNDATVNAIITLLNNGGYFPSLNAGTVNANEFVGGNYSGINAILSRIYAQVFWGNFQGGDGVFNNLSASNLFANSFTGGGQNLTLPYGSFYQNGNTALTGNITNVSTTPIPVTSTAGFESSGFIIIGNEIIQYTSKTATTFDGTITRGVKSTTNVAHNTGAAVSEAAGVAAGSSAAANLDAVVVSNGITCTVPDSKVYFTYSGVYNIQFSAQLLNYSNAEDNVTIWFKKNNVDIPESASVEQVNAKHGSNPGATIMALNYMDSFDAGDYFELYWASNSGDTVLATYPPGTSPVHPASPSLILTVTFVSGSDGGAAQRGLVPIGVPGIGKVGTITIDVTNNTA